jgi:predicted transcriptional regulator
MTTPATTTSASTTSHLTVDRVMRPAVTTVERTAHVAAVAYLMRKHHDSAIVVVTDDRAGAPLTLICDSDVTQAVADGRNLEEARITDLTLPEMVAVAPDTPVAQAAERLLAAGVVMAPVVADGRLVGLVDMSGLCLALLTELRPPPRGVARP